MYSIDSSLSDLDLERKQIIVFDLDGVLAESKTDVSPKMSDLLQKLLVVMKVAIISGASFKQYLKQVLPFIKTGLENLYLLPTCGSRMYAYKENEWSPIFQNLLNETEKKKIINSLNIALSQYGHNPLTTYGPMIEDRDTQITFSALGQEAPLHIKEKWDPDQKKRQEIKKILDTLIPEFEVRLGGTTSIDITRKRIDKSYGVNKIIEYFDYNFNEILFVGDALYPGGNDRPVLEMGIKSVEVKSPKDTERLITRIINNS